MPAANFEIRALNNGEIEALCGVRNDPAMHRQRMQEQEQGLVRYIGAFAGKQAAGFVLLVQGNKIDVMPYTAGAPCMDMVDLFVREELRGQGIGSALIAAVEEASAAQGVRYIGLDVNPADNADAQALYARLGYRTVGELHLDGTYPSKDAQGNDTVYEDWCVDMLKDLRG